MNQPLLINLSGRLAAKVSLRDYKKARTNSNKLIRASISVRTLF